MDRAGILQLVSRGWSAVRFRGVATQVGACLVNAIKALTLPAEYDPEADFSALAVQAPSIEDARSALRDVDPEWWAPVPCDDKLRPLTRWNSLQWVATDETALSDAETEARRKKRATIDTEIETLRRVRYRAAGIYG